MKAMRGLTNSFALDGHAITVRVRRLRFGAPEVYAAQCTCGWRGEERLGRTADRIAKRDGAIHFDQSRVTQTSRSGASQ